MRSMWLLPFFQQDDKRERERESSLHRLLHDIPTSKFCVHQMRWVFEGASASVLCRGVILRIKMCMSWQTQSCHLVSCAQTSVRSSAKKNEGSLSEIKSRRGRSELIAHQKGGICSAL